MYHTSLKMQDGTTFRVESLEPLAYCKRVTLYWGGIPMMAVQVGKQLSEGVFKASKFNFGLPEDLRAIVKGVSKPTEAEKVPEPIPVAPETMDDFVAILNDEGIKSITPQSHQGDEGVMSLGIVIVTKTGRAFWLDQMVRFRAAFGKLDVIDYSTGEGRFLKEPLPNPEKPDTFGPARPEWDVAKMNRQRLVDETR